jgi:hypothetical protein
MTTVQSSNSLRPLAPIIGNSFLRQGSQGAQVRDLQSALKALGFDPGVIDGIFGAQTGVAVRDFQGAHNLDADGVVGARTQATLNARLEALAQKAGQIDTRTTWKGAGQQAYLNFGHRLVDDQYVRAKADGRLVWRDSNTLVNPHQRAAMGSRQREHFLSQVPANQREKALEALNGGNASASKAPVPAEPKPSPTQVPSSSSSAGQQMKNLLAEARRNSVGKRPDGWCYMHVWNFIARSGYGNMPGQGIPDSHAAYAKQFSYYADANLSRLGLRKLKLDNPYKAPPGAIVVVRPGTPGTAHPVAGDIAVTDGNGRIFNGGEMGYGGEHHFRPGNNYVLGIYVPA